MKGLNDINEEMATSNKISLDSDSTTSSAARPTIQSLNNNNTTHEYANLNDTDRCDPKVLTTQSRGFKWERKFYSNRNEFPVCKFTSIEDGGPIPVIFLVNGRSGSDVTWATITKLAGKKSPIGEHTGENKVKAMVFLGSMKTEDEGAWWITEHLCEFSRRHCDKPIVGIKWKPFVDSWLLPSSQGMLKKIATFDTPQIKMIFMTRNPIDVMISKLKHKGSKIKAHCKPDDEICQKKFAKKGTGLVLPTETLIQDLNDIYAGFDLFESQLKELNISYIKISYEELYDRTHADEWLKTFRFLGRGPQEKLTIDQVQATFQYAPTFAANHEDSLANYMNVSRTLANTKYKLLLH